MADINTVDFSLAAKNHNNPPSELEFLEENLKKKNIHALKAAEGHIEMAGNIPDHFTQANEAAFVTDFIKLVGNCQKEFERRRKEEKEPFLRQGQFVDDFFKSYIQKLQAAIDKATLPLNDWLKRQAEAERAAREADAKLLMEQAQAALKNAASIDRTEITQQEASEIIQHAVVASETAKVGEAIAAAPIESLARATGKTASAALTKKWVGTIKNADDLNLTKLRPYIPLAELEKAVERFVRQGGRQLEGAEIKEVTIAKVK